MVQQLCQMLKLKKLYVKGDYQGHKLKVFDFWVICKGCISWVYMPNQKSLSLTVQKLGTG